MRSFLCVLLLFCVAMSQVTAAEPEGYSRGAEDFLDEMVERHAFDAKQLTELLAQARYRQEIIDAISRPWEAKPWHQYRPHFLTKKRITAGVSFMRRNKRLLERAEAEYGVPAELITAIIGVETNYGANLGKHRVIDALTTLGFSYPKRASFFRDELEEFLLLTREEGLDPLALRGSYAGALGMPQFIPSSYRAYALDFDGDGRRDLWTSRADVIGSVAGYFVRHGWQRGGPVAFQIEVPESLPPDLLVVEKKPRNPYLAPARLADADVALPEGIDENQEMVLMRLEAPEDEYWLGTANFYTITRYNHSNLYAMAVFQLSQIIKELHQAKK